MPAMQACGLGLLPYFPLAGGLLTGKYKRQAPPPPGARLARSQGMAVRYLTPANWTIVEALEEFCARRGHGLLELAFSWLTSRPRLASVIAGATKAEQVEQNVKAAGWTLTADDLAEIDRLTASGVICVVDRNCARSFLQMNSSAIVRDARRFTPSPRVPGEGGMRGRRRDSEPVETPPHRAEIGFSALLGTLSPHAGRGPPRSQRFRRA